MLKRFYLLLVALCAITMVKAQAPAFSTETAPVWQKIGFEGTEMVLSDQEAGNAVALAIAAENDANKWNLVGNSERFYAVSKLGYYLAYDSENGYTTTADKKAKAILTIATDGGKTFIKRSGAETAIAVANGTITETAEGTAATFSTKASVDPDIFSTIDAPRYFQVVYQNGDWAIADKGNNELALTAASDNSNAAQLWQFVGTPDEFYMLSKNGNYLAGKTTDNVYFYYSTTNEANKVSFKVFKTKNASFDGAYEIQRIGVSNQCINMYQGAGNGKKISEWTTGDGGNPIAFIAEGETPEPLPYFSTADAPKYWWVQFNKGGAALADKGAGEIVKTAAKAYNDAQLWQLVGDEKGFYMKSQKGNYLSWNGSRFATTSTESSKATLILHKTGVADAAGCYEIQLKGGSYMNQHGGSGADKELGTWNFGDSNNPVSFVSGSVEYPIFSTDEAEEWYFIQFCKGGGVILDNGAGKNITTSGIDDVDTQKWKIVGNKDNCQFINKKGNYLTYKSSYVQTATTADSKGFKLIPTANAKYPLQIEIQYNGTSSKPSFNQWGGSTIGNNIGLWDANDENNPLTFISVNDIVYPEFKVAESAATAPEEKLTLWYTQPATATGVANKWMEYSLPIGNGQFGASLFGGVAKDEILFNEKTLWSGGPNEYGYYLVFGSLFIEDLSGDFTYSSEKPIKNYYRDLNLRTATGTMSYENGNGVKFTRQYIASYPDKAVVTKITASEGGKLNLRFTMESGKPTVNAETTYENGYGQFSGKLQTISYNATFKVIAEGGIIATGADGIVVEEADEVLVILAGCTDFVANDASHINGRAELLPADNKAIIDAVEKKGWDAVYADHVADHQQYFNRVDFNLAGVSNNVPTNQLVDNYSKSKSNRMLEQIYFNYGRYLEIASSRGVELPRNLQGIWNNSCTPPWHSDIHANINVQMNYWPAETTNMSEMHVPFLKYIINEAAQPEWQNRATIAGEKRGWTCLTENNIFGGISGFAPNYVIANAWYGTHLWQHYRYTLDKEYLAEAFPAMLGAAQFWADRMILAEDGTYECPNEYSPEHGPGSENGVAHAQQITWEILDNTIKAADILGGVEAGVISQEDYDLFIDRFAKMDKGLATEKYEQNGGWPATRNGIKTGDEIIREWKYSRFYASGDQGHRHMSHLMALYPFGQITPNSKFFEPAINSMKLRGDESTGWSMGWKINLWARALNGDRSLTILQKALRHSTSYGTDQSQGGIYYNLFDSHAPFQIDGNFGACAGIAEMLMQSYTDTISILPALPSAWMEGSVKGLKAVGDFTVGIEWSDNKATRIDITNNQGQPLYVNYPALETATIFVGSQEVEPQKEGNAYFIPTTKGDDVTIFFGAVPTGIENIKGEKGDGTIYDLQGRKVNTPIKGRVYIQNKQKFIAK